MAVNWEQEFANIGESLPSDLNQAIIDAAMIVVEQIRSEAPQGESGDLKRSIKMRLVDGDFLGITMEDYGWYVNYGVRGLKNKRQQFGVPEPVATFLGVPDGYEFHFGTKGGEKKPNKHYWGIHYPGIRGRMFFRVEEAIDEVARIINQNLEL